MLLRVVGGRVLAGRESEFVDLCRRQVAAGARAPGLLSFMAGYRRVEGLDRFVLVSSWQTDRDAERTAGTEATSRAAQVLSDVAVIEQIDQYELLEPAFGGILDTPGAVVRVARATIRPGQREPLFAWLNARQRNIRGEQLMLAWAMGRRERDGRDEAIAVTGWASPMMIEAVAESGRAGKLLFAALDEFVTDVNVEQYQAIEMQLPERMADLSSRRLVAARYESTEAAMAARDALGDQVPSAAESPILIAALGSPGREAGNDQLLVARVAMVEYGHAERLIVEHGGQIVLATSESDAARTPESRPGPPG